MKIPYEMIEINILVNGGEYARCDINKTQENNNSQIICKTGSFFTGPGKVRLQMAENSSNYVESSNNFTYLVSKSLLLRMVEFVHFSSTIHVIVSS